MEGPAIVIFTLVVSLIVAFVIKGYDAREQQLLEALKNSNIVCEPVKVDDKYYCGTKRVFVTNGVEHTVEVDKLN